MTSMNRSMSTRITAPVMIVSAIGLTGCSTNDTETQPVPTFRPASVELTTGQIALPDGAWNIANAAAEQCATDAVTTELVIGKIAATTGYDPDFTATDGRAGTAGMYPEKWATYGTDDLADRSDLSAASDATAAELCDAYTTAQTLSEDGAEGTVDDLALSVVLMGERYTRDEGVTDAETTHDPHDVRVTITEIRHAAESITS